MVAKPLGWFADDSHHVVVRERAEGVAKGELRNPDFPSEVGAGVGWFGTIDGVNIGDAEGQFRFRVEEPGAAPAVTDPFYLDPSATKTQRLIGVGPSEYTIYLERYGISGWVVDDTYYMKVEEAEVPEAKGEIVDLWFLSEVAVDQYWFGWVEGENIGGAKGTFRFRVDTSTTKPFDLSPGSGLKTTISGTGPAEFTAYFERETPAGWVVDDSRHIIITEAVTPPEGKKATRMVVTIAPPPHTSIGEEGFFQFKGHLEDVYGNRLAEKLVTLYLEWEGTIFRMNIYTQSDGGWRFYRMGSYTPVTFTIYVYFEGDAYYTGSKTPTYTTVVS